MPNTYPAGAQAVNLERELFRATDQARSNLTQAIANAEAKFANANRVFRQELNTAYAMLYTSELGTFKEVQEINPAARPQWIDAIVRARANLMQASNTFGQELEIAYSVFGQASKGINIRHSQAMASLRESLALEEQRRMENYYKRVDEGTKRR